MENARIPRTAVSAPRTATRLAKPVTSTTPTAPFSSPASPPPKRVPYNGGPTKIHTCKFSTVPPHRTCEFSTVCQRPPSTYMRTARTAKSAARTAARPAKPSQAQTQPHPYPTPLILLPTRVLFNGHPTPPHPLRTCELSTVCQRPAASAGHSVVTPTVRLEPTSAVLVAGEPATALHWEGQALAGRVGEWGGGWGRGWGEGRVVTCVHMYMCTCNTFIFLISQV